MADQLIPRDPEDVDRRIVDCGGLQFEATFRAPAGATLRVFGEIDGSTTELLRFDDFVDGPHYHVPAAGGSIPFDRALGEPLTWFVAQVRDRLETLLEEAGFGQIQSSVDRDAVAEHSADIRAAMEACVPDGYVRVPGVGLRRSPA